MIDGIPNRPVYFYQKDIIGFIPQYCWLNLLSTLSIFYFCSGISWGHQPLNFSVSLEIARQNPRCCRHVPTFLCLCQAHRSDLAPPESELPTPHHCPSSAAAPRQDAAGGGARAGEAVGGTVAGATRAELSVAMRFSEFGHWKWGVRCDFPREFDVRKMVIQWDWIGSGEDIMGYATGGAVEILDWYNHGTCSISWDISI